MGHTRFLRIALPAIAIPALIVLVLPADIWPTYVDVVEPVALLAGSSLALQVSFSYRKELKIAFIFLSVFLLIYAVAIVLLLSFSPRLVPYLATYLEEAEIVTLVQTIQFVNYAMLFFFCINILRVIDVTKLNKKGWIVFAGSMLFSYSLAMYPVLPSIARIGSQTASEISYLAIRVLDAGLIIVLTPVLWLYVQYLKAQQRQSLTFTVVIFGIIFFTLFDYLFESIITTFPLMLPEDSSLYAVIPEMLFVYGYLVIAVGLYAHHRDDEWGYQAVDRALSGELKMVEGE